MSLQIPIDLQTMLQKLDEPLARYSMLDLYYSGTQSLAFLSPEAKTALGSRFGRMASNIPRLAVTALAERLRITGFSDPDLWTDWIRCDLDQQAGVAHREALLLGDAYVIVWADDQGRPKVTVESAKQVAVQTDPGTRQIVAAVKRWETKTTTEAVLYLPDQIVRLRANATGATTQGFSVIETIVNPLGVVPVVNLRNTDRLPVNWLLPDRGASEIDDLVPLVDALNKSLADMMVTSEYVGRPRRWATGIELVEEPVLDAAGNPVVDEYGDPVPPVEVNPIPEGARAMISENDAAKFGQLVASDLAGYEASVRVILGQIMAVSTLPAHYVGIFTDNPASADAMRAAEASLTARAEARQATFGRSWEQVARLMIAVRDGTGSVLDRRCGCAVGRRRDPLGGSRGRRGRETVRRESAARQLRAQEARLHRFRDSGDPYRAPRRVAGLAGCGSHELDAAASARRNSAGERIDSAADDESAAVTYQQTLKALAASGEATAVALWRRVDDPTDDFDDEMFTATLGASLAIHNARAQSLSQLAFSAQAMIATGAAVAVAGLPVRDDIARLRAAAATVLDVARDSNDPDAIVGRLGRYEPLTTGHETFDAVITDSNLVDGWTRGVSAGGCELCQEWADDGAEFGSDEDMEIHPGCGCVQEPIFTT